MQVKEKDFNPISLAARMYQEMGTGTSLYNLYSGVYTGDSNAFYGYYNFYNIGVNSSCVNNITNVDCLMLKIMDGIVFIMQLRVEQIC